MTLQDYIDNAITSAELSLLSSSSLFRSEVFLYIYFSLFDFLIRIYFVANLIFYYYAYFGGELHFLLPDIHSFIFYENQPKETARKTN